MTYTLVNNTAITQSVGLTLPKLIQKGTELPKAEFEPGQEPEGLTKWNYDIASGEAMTVTYAYRYAYPGETVTFRRWNTIDEDPNTPLWSFALRINNRTRQPMMKSGFGTRTEAASLGRIEETS